tara:strand:+ start:582 stop:1007 length:426 start_codon:yes stop_codon:yes gene_type:complete
MPKNKGKGGKQFRRGKNPSNINEKRQLEFKEDQQEYAHVTKMLGNGRCECMCSDGRTRLGVIRGAMSKRVWITMGDLVLVSLREYQDDKADIIHKYTHEEANTLKNYGEINANMYNTHPNLAIAYEEQEESEETGIDFEDI